MATYKPFNLSCLLQTHQNSTMEERVFLHAMFDHFVIFLTKLFSLIADTVIKQNCVNLSLKQLF